MLGAPPLHYSQGLRCTVHSDDIMCYRMHFARQCPAFVQGQGWEGVSTEKHVKPDISLY